MLDNVESDCRLYGSVATAESGRKKVDVADTARILPTARKAARGAVRGA